ncbi:hypothetical protein H696_01028 [Fonticula alba]|uniref:DNA replication complex GINS protein SLD5 n=1 Tax=Fonticula alba TaxID=691883 RepID=A0A058ZB12_FONAL|nr:hypothetical protein H696_01028 [Fonticula alba]KCV71610.1 hypothetical protein H696_01028 [Fonticula alba]|eukprot:XP_009493188.1 hypothetical protein H696_01028 [Fonticula alba]
MSGPPGARFPELDEHGLFSSDEENFLPSGLFQSVDPTGSLMAPPSTGTMEPGVPGAPASLGELGDTKAEHPTPADATSGSQLDLSNLDTIGLEFARAAGLLEPMPEAVAEPPPPDALPGATHGATLSSEESVSPGAQDFRLMLRAWQNELHAPEILPWAGGPFGRLFQSIREQRDVIDDLKAGGTEDAFIAVIMQTDLERVKYVLRAYVKARLSKINQFCHNILFQPVLRERLTPRERAYARRMQTIWDSHILSSAVGALPPLFAKLEDPHHSNMIRTPNLDALVFVRALTPEGVTLEIEDGAKEVNLLQGGISTVTYAEIEELLLQSQVELL